MIKNRTNFKNSGEQATDWWKRTIAYEIYPSSFQDSNGDGIGDLAGIQSRLGYLESLGVGALWLTPVYASPMVDNGYDVSDYYAINPMFGTMADMERLIAEGRKRGIRIVMDLVMNHTSDRCQWFLESKASRHNARSDWYIWRDPRLVKDEATGELRRRPPNNWRGIFGGSVWEWNEERGQYYMHTFATAQPDLNWENPEVRRALYDIANFWIEKGVGGFRIDAIPYIKKPQDFGDGEPDAGDGLVSVHTMTVNTDGILDFLYEFKRNVTEGKEVFTVAEANGVGPDDLKYWVGDKGAFDMLFEFGHLHDVEIWCKPSPYGIMDFKKAIIASQKATATNGWYPVFFENHDKPRSINNYFGELPAQQAKLAAKALGMLMFTLRGTPFVYQGQELGMTNVKWTSIDDYDELNSRAQYKIALSEGFSASKAMEFVNTFSRDNARTPMHWSGEKSAGFTTGTPWLKLNENFREINVALEESDENSVLSWYKKLSKLRSESPALLEGAFEAILPEHPQVFAFRRTLENKTFTVVVNLSANRANVDDELLKGAEVVLGNYENPSAGFLRPFEAALLRCETPK